MDDGIYIVLGIAAVLIISVIGYSLYKDSINEINRINRNLDDRKD